MLAKLRWAALAFAVLVALAGLLWIARAKSALEKTRVEVAGASIIPSEFRALRESKPTAVDFLNTPPEFRDAEIFHDFLYICGAGGIWVYDLAGNLRTSYLVGRDLPPSPPVAMAVGTLAGDVAPKLWVATSAAGILVFDGARFSQIEPRTKESGNITSLLMMPTGRLLAGFSIAGVVVYDGKTLAPFHPSLRNVAVTALSGTDGSLWIGTRDRGVLRFEAGRMEEFHEESGLPDNRVLSIASAAGRVYVGTPVGVAEFQDGKPSRMLAEGVFSRALLVDGGRLLVGTLDEGILEVNLSKERGSRFTLASNSDRLAPTRFLAADGHNYALTHDGLFEEEPRSGVWAPRIVTAEPTLTDRNVSALSLDTSGRLWVGYFDKGIDIARANDMRKTAHVEDEHVFCVNRIVYDSYRNIHLVATANGLALFSPDGKLQQVMDKRDGLISDHVNDIAAGPDGMILATGAGLTMFNADGPQSIYAFHGLANNHVYSVGLSASRLLAGTLGGLSMVENGVVRTSYTTANSPLRQNWISAIVPSGNDWFVGTYGAGVVQLKANEEWVDFPDMPSNVVINPNAMVSAANLIIAGTLDRGLLIYDVAGNRWSLMADGLPSLNVTALAASEETLFAGTDNGIVRIRMDKLR